MGIADRSDYDLSRHTQFSREDLSVFVPYDEPVKVKRRRVVPNIPKLGPAFRDRAKKIAEELEKLEDAGDEVVLTINGEEIKVPSEYYEIREVEEEVHGERVVPHVIEPSFGLDRITYAVLEHAFDTDTVDGEERRVLRLERRLAPVQVAVLPLLSRDEFVEEAETIAGELRENGIYTELDITGSIGRRYRRYDEIGTPFCITIDHQTFEDGTVTIRDRDSTSQVRVKKSELVRIIQELLNSGKSITEFGEVFRP